MIGLGLALAALSAAVPALGYVGLVWWIDRHEKEPLHLLGIAFFWGVVPAALLSVAIALVLDHPLSTLGSPFQPWREAHVLAPAIEEVVKGAILLSLFRRHRAEFHGLLDGIIYGAFVGLGFALTENFLTFAAAFEQGTPMPVLALIALRTGIFGLNHPVFSALVGAGLGWARYERRIVARRLVPPACLAGAIALHALHNALTGGGAGGVVVAGLADAFAMGFVGLLIWLAWRYERRWLVEGLRFELDLDTVSPAEYALALSQARRATVKWRALRRSGWRGWSAVSAHLEALTELGFASFHARHPAGQPADDHLAGELPARRSAVRAARLALIGAARPASDHRAGVAPPETAQAAGDIAPADAVARDQGGRDGVRHS